ncbi:MAG: hypothetical protein E7653_06700 [Ruminococcaceae bacterium]|nr:hypothetical protein [Oscillospiraceae bacterium]
MIITIKDKKSVWLAVGAAGVMINAHNDDLIHEDNLNLWHVTNVQNCLMSSVHPRGIDVDRIRYHKQLGLSDPLTQQNLILNTVPKLKQIFEECDMMDGKESWQTLVIAKEKKAFVIRPSFTCCEIEDFDVCGNGDDTAYGAMMYYKDLPPVERIAQTFRTLEKMRRTKHFPVVIMNTMTKDRIVIYE